MPSRKRIRQAVRDGLLDQTMAGEAVFATRMIPARPEQHPAILAVYTFDDEVDPDTDWEPNGVNRQILTLVIEIVSAGDGADDRIDDVADEIEARLAADPQLMAAAGVDVPFVERVTKRGLDVGRAEESDRLLVGRQTWRVTYYTVPETDDGNTPSAVFVNEGAPYCYAGEDDYRDILAIDD